MMPKYLIFNIHIIYTENSLTFGLGAYYKGFGCSIPFDSIWHLEFEF